MIILKEEAGGKDFAIAPQGNHLACCYRIVDFGTQKTSWEGNIKLKRQLHFSFELHGNDADDQPLLVDGKPMVVSKRYNMSFFETASLRLDLESWRGKPFSTDELAGFDLSNVLGKFCMLNVLHQKVESGKTYANIKGISPVPSALKSMIPDQVNPSVIFSLDAFDQKVFDGLPDWMKEIIQQSPEYQTKDAPGNPFPEEAIPF
jgi:hypothetical protein